MVPPIHGQPYGLDVDLAITHPFPGFTEYTGFDVRGIIMLEGTYNFPGLNCTTTRATTGEWALLNPDGYTKVFNAQNYTMEGIFGYSTGKMISPSWPDPSNTLNAFRAYYSDGQSEDVGGRRAFFAGDTVTRTYEIQLVTGDPFRFWYAVDASWEPPSGDEPYELDDFSIAANCPEAFRFDFSVVSGELHPEDGTVHLGVDIWDHQGWSPPYNMSYEAPGCSNLPTIIMGGPLYIDGIRSHWEISVTNYLGGLDLSTGTEFLLYCKNSDDDPFTGNINAYGRFTIPVSEPGECNSNLHHNYLGTGDFSGGTHMSAYDGVFVHDTGTLNDGEFLGYISGIAGTVVQTYIIDTLTPVDGDTLGAGWGNPHIGSWPVPLSIDVSEESGQFFIVWDDTFSLVEVWDAVDGKLAGETDASSGGRVFSLDTDGSGGFWNGYYPEMGFAPGIKHFTPDGPQPGELVEKTEDHISLPETWGTPHEVICIPDEVLLVLTGSQSGKIRAYDISTSPPVYIDSIDGLFSDDLDFGTFLDKPCDMAADWSDPDLAHCRIIVFGNLASGGVELVKIGSDLTIWAGPNAIESSHYQSIDINPNTGDVALWPETDGSPGEYALVEQPADW